MPEMLSPGVYVTEIDASTIAPTVSNSITVFAGKFDKGPVDTYTLITTVDELITFYGLPGDDNYNDWYQCYNFLQYGNKLYVARAANINGAVLTGQAAITQDEIFADAMVAPFSVTSTDTSGLEVGGLVSFGDGSDTQFTYYEVTAIADDVSFNVDRPIEDAFDPGSDVNTFDVATNGVFEPVIVGGTAIVTGAEYLDKNLTIMNANEFEALETSIAMTSDDAKIKIIARNPGDWAEDLEIAIAKPSAFNLDVPSMVFDGISLDDLFEYFPTGTEVGIVIRVGDVITEVFTVDFDPAAKDVNGKSTYIESVIFNNSNLIYVKDNTAAAEDIENYIHELGDVEGGTATALETISLLGAHSSSIQMDDLLNAYELWDNKEEVDIDIVIANELDGGASAKALCDTRKDCIGFIGAYYGDTVGKKASQAVAKLIAWRKFGDLNYNNMFVVSCANYKYQYDRYNDKMRWMNIAGDIAGLRAQTSSNRASWWASAGLERGQLKNVKKLAFNPNQGHRDLLYKNGLNPIVAFPDQGKVMWGQKTLLDKPSSFDRVNVRGLFNTMERSLSKMAKYQVMEFNDNFTRNRIISMIKPFLGSVQAGRGIQDFLVICDTSNNTPDVISRNQLVVDVYIKPTYVAEFIHLKFTNAGTNSFSEVIGG